MRNHTLNQKLLYLFLLSQIYVHFLCFDVPWAFKSSFWKAVCRLRSTAKKCELILMKFGVWTYFGDTLEAFFLFLVIQNWWFLSWKKKKKKPNLCLIKFYTSVASKESNKTYLSSTIQKMPDGNFGGRKDSHEAIKELHCHDANACCNEINLSEIGPASSKIKRNFCKRIFWIFLTFHLQYEIDQ